MKKQVLVLLVIVIILSTTIQAALPYKETLETNNYKINSVQCSNNKLRVLVESKAEVNLKILFKVYSSKGSINIFSDKLLKRLSADWFDIDTNLACSDLLRLEVNGYAPIENNQNVVYMNTELSYQFTGNKAQILHNIANTTNTIISVPTSPESIMPVYPYFSYVYFNGRLIQSINENNEETYYAQDQIGSNTMLTDYNGNIIAKNEYDPFGRDVSSNKGEFKFTGKEQDYSGLYYYGARYYDNSIGRFTQIDPEFKAIESGYAYADNNPLIKNDPTGKTTANSNADENIVEYRLISELPVSEQRFLMTGILPSGVSLQRESLNINKFVPSEESVYLTAAMAYLPIKYARWAAKGFATINLFDKLMKLAEGDVNRVDKDGFHVAHPSSVSDKRAVLMAIALEVVVFMIPSSIGSPKTVMGKATTEIASSPAVSPAVSAIESNAPRGILGASKIVYGAEENVILSNGKNVIKIPRFNGNTPMTPEYINPLTREQIPFHQVEPYLR